jgi:hypothetical protein
MTPEDKPLTGAGQPASIAIRTERLVAEISRHSAELIRLQDRDGKDLAAYYWPPTPARASRLRFPCWARLNRPSEPSLMTRPSMAL